MIITRFNPGANGGLHLGHLYMALMNRALGDKFIVRWDNSSLPYTETIGQERMDRIVDGQKEELEWLGFEPASWIRQSDVIDEVHEWLSDRLDTPPDDIPYILPELTGNDYTMLYPLTSLMTAEKVVMDYQEGVNLLVRGIDLLSEYSLYQYFCKMLDLPQPRHIYLPRLKSIHGDISKTNGSQSISDLRSAGYMPEYIRGMVEKACLQWPANGWSVHNLKEVPRL